MTSRFPLTHPLRTPTRALVAAVVLPLALTACAGEDTADSSTAEISAPPDRESVKPVVAPGVELPAWGYSATCDQSRPAAESDGLVTPDPVAGDQDVPFYVPGVEEVLCNINGVESASVAGTYSVEDGTRSGSVDIGVLMDADSVEEDMRAARQAGVTAAREQDLADQGLSVGSFTIYLTDGSFVEGPSQTLSADGSSTLTGQGIRVLDELRNAGPGQRWSVEIADELVLSTYLTAQTETTELPADLEAAQSALSEIQTPAVDLERSDRVVVTDEDLTVVYESGGDGALPAAITEDLQQLSRHDGVDTVEAEVTTDAQGRDVLRVQTHALDPGRTPSTESEVEDLRAAALSAGLRLEHSAVGAPSPTESPSPS